MNLGLLTLQLGFYRRYCWDLAPCSTKYDSMGGLIVTSVPFTGPLINISADCTQFARQTPLLFAHSNLLRARMQNSVHAQSDKRESDTARRRKAWLLASGLETTEAVPNSKTTR